MLELRLELRKQERVGESQGIVDTTRVELLPRHEHRPGFRARVSDSALRAACGYTRIDPDQRRATRVVLIGRVRPRMRYRTIAGRRSIRHDLVLHMRTMRSDWTCREGAALPIVASSERRGTSLLRKMVALLWRRLNGRLTLMKQAFGRMRPGLPLYGRLSASCR